MARRPPCPCDPAAQRPGTSMTPVGATARSAPSLARTGREGSPEYRLRSALSNGTGGVQTCDESDDDPLEKEFVGECVGEDMSGGLGKEGVTRRRGGALGDEASTGQAGQGWRRLGRSR